MKRVFLFPIVVSLCPITGVLGGYPCEEIDCPTDVDTEIDLAYGCVNGTGYHTLCYKNAGSGRTVKAHVCSECPSAYTPITNAINITIGCDIETVKCECICTPECTADASYSRVDRENYAKKVMQRSCSCSGNQVRCIETKSAYRCIDKYYGVPTVDTPPTCTECPKGPNGEEATSTAGENTHITSCSIKFKDGEYFDGVGIFTLGQDVECKHK
ncbi:hypothetical protein HDR61_04230 [bacterium]|nr:hypothetical protein [bacterium]